MTTLSGRRVLVLGASGFIGRWVTVHAAALGAEVVAVARRRDRMPTRAAALALEVVEAELARQGTVRELVDAHRPDVVFNLAAYGVSRFETDATLHAQLNTGLVEELAQALLEMSPGPGEHEGVRLIQPGSSLEYGRTATSLDEAAPCKPDTPYGRTKLAATEHLFAARERGLASLVPRAFMVFGAGERPGRLVPSLLQGRDADDRIALSEGTQARDWAYVEDVARALVGLACVDASKVVDRVAPFDTPGLNVASGELLSVRDFVEFLADELGIGDHRLGFGDLAEDAREMRHPAVPVARLVAALGRALPSELRSGVSELKARLEEGWEPVGRFPEGGDGQI